MNGMFYGLNALVSFDDVSYYDDCVVVDHKLNPRLLYTNLMNMFQSGIC